MSNKNNPLNQLFELSPQDQRNLYHDLTQKYLTEDFYKITADFMDPHQQTIIVQEPQKIKDQNSKKLIKQSYVSSIDTINAMSPKYHYEQTIKDESLPIIIITEPTTPDKHELKVRQVIPFNLWLGFSLPIMINEPHLLESGLTKRLNPQIHQYTESLLINWLNLPWLLKYKLNNPDTTIDELYRHSLVNYQIQQFNQDLTVTFKLNDDHLLFSQFLTELKLPKVISISVLKPCHYQIQIKQPA